MWGKAKRTAEFPSVVSTERRRFIRLQHRLKGTFHFLRSGQERPESASPFHFKTRNISQGGLRLDVQELPSATLGDLLSGSLMLDLEMDLGPPFGEFLSQARVRWIECYDEDAHGLGLEFVNTATESQVRLSRFLSERLNWNEPSSSRTRRSRVLRKIDWRMTTAVMLFVMLGVVVASWASGLFIDFVDGVGARLDQIDDVARNLRSLRKRAEESPLKDMDPEVIDRIEEKVREQKEPLPYIDPELLERLERLQELDEKAENH